MKGGLRERGPKQGGGKSTHACGLRFMRVDTTRGALRRCQHAPVFKRSTACFSMVLRLRRTTCNVPALLRTWASHYERTC